MAEKTRNEVRHAVSIEIGSTIVIAIALEEVAETKQRTTAREVRTVACQKNRKARSCISSTKHCTELLQALQGKG